MLKLVSITFDRAPRIPGVRPGDMSTIECLNPNNALKGWRATLRGPALYLISPAGWLPGRSANDFDKTAPAIVHEIPRADCYLHWSGTDTDIETIAKGRFDSPPFAPEDSPDSAKQKTILSQLDSKDRGDA